MRDIRRVLVVEDDQHLLKLMATWLQSMSCVVHTAQTVEEARTALGEHAMDLVLTDFMLPDGDGNHILALVTARTPMPLLMVMSGMASASVAFHMGKSGVAAYLEKPFSQDTLRRALEEARMYRFQVPLMAASCVGNESVRKLAGDIRDTMTTQAMALADGNRTRAARYLKIQRQSLMDK